MEDITKGYYNKILLLGSDQVGKTSLVHFTAGKSFNSTYLKTKDVTPVKTTFSSEIHFQISEIPRQDFSFDLLPYFVETVDAVVVMYNVADKESILFATDILKKLPEQPVGRIIVLVGNKADLDKVEMCSTADKSAETREVPHYEISLLTTGNCAELMENIDKLIRNRKAPKFAEYFYDLESFDMKYNVILLGNSRVGKSSFFLRFFSGEFYKESKSTIGMVIKHKYFEPIKGSGSKFKLDMWDTAGQEQFKSIPANYYKNSQACLLLFSVDDRKSFEDIQFWMKDLNSKCRKDVIIYIIGNKIDLLEKRTVTKEEGIAFEEMYPGVQYYESSVMLDINCSNLIYKLVEKITFKQEERTISLWASPPETDESGCC